MSSQLKSKREPYGYNKPTNQASSGSSRCGSRLWKIEYMVIAILLLIIFNFSTRTLNVDMEDYLRCETKDKQIDHSTLSSITKWARSNRIGAIVQSIESRRSARVLVSIFSADLVNEARYRHAFRDLLRMHPKVCTLTEYTTNEHVQNGPCEFIYTFVLGGNTDENAPYKIVSNTSATSILATELPTSKHSNDLHEKDITFLNIKENMNYGKSQTWFYYAGTILDKYGIDYVMKIDTDSLLHLDRYFKFAERSLPPPPYNTRILAGVPIDKQKDWNMDKDHVRKTEPYFDSIYGGVHIYAAGQMYILSSDLVKGVAHVSAHDKDIGEYAEGHEDHDISAMAFLSLKYGEQDQPIKFILLPLTDPFWRHPVKIQDGVSKWKEEWDNVRKRIKQDPNLKLVSTSPNNDVTSEIHHRTTKTTTDVPIIYKSDQERWIEHFETNNTNDMIPDMFKFLNAVQVNNSIASNNTCFLNSGYLQRPLKFIKVFAPTTKGSGIQWDKLTKFIYDNFPTGIDVLSLPNMDVGMARSDNIHTVQVLAEALHMNFAWAINNVEWISATESSTETTTGTNYRYTGPAILSKCTLYDPYILREFENQESVDILKSKSGLFVRMKADTKSSTDGIGYHVIAGSVSSNLDIWKNRKMIWEYQYGYSPTTTDSKTGVSTSNQLGSIIGGNIKESDCEDLLGLKKLTTTAKTKHVVVDETYVKYPEGCHSNNNDNTKHGLLKFRATNNVCTNLMLSPPELIKNSINNNNNKSYVLYVPCLEQKTNDTTISTSLAQQLDHSVLFAAVH